MKNKPRIIQAGKSAGEYSEQKTKEAVSEILNDLTSRGCGPESIVLRSIVFNSNDVNWVNVWNLIKKEFVLLS